MCSASPHVTWCTLAAGTHAPRWCTLAADAWCTLAAGPWCTFAAYGWCTIARLLTPRTEEAYFAWIRRCISFHDKHHR